MHDEPGMAMGCHFILKILYTQSHLAANLATLENIYL